MEGTGAVRIVPADAVKRVGKPWGSELWVAEGGQAQPYALKIISLRAGQRTSLQMHERKAESNFILSGSATLTYSDATREIVSQRHLAPGDAYHVPPGIVHRLHALTDVLLIEASTPEVDDVIRLADDTGRPDGRIAKEHGE